MLTEPMARLSATALLCLAAVLAGEGVRVRSVRGAAGGLSADINTLGGDQKLDVVQVRSLSARSSRVHQ